MTTVMAPTDRIPSMTSGHPEVVIESGHRWG